MLMEAACFSEADLMQGVELQAWDYDLTSSDDLLGIGALRRLDELKKFPGQVRQFQCPLMYKGKHRGEASCHCKLKMPGGGAAAPSAPSASPARPLGAVGGQIFNAAMGGGAVATAVAPAGAAQQYMTVTCPANARGGMQVIVQSP